MRMLTVQTVRHIHKTPFLVFATVQLDEPSYIHYPRDSYGPEYHRDDHLPHSRSLSLAGQRRRTYNNTTGSTSIQIAVTMLKQFK